MRRLAGFTGDFPAVDFDKAARHKDVKAPDNLVLEWMWWSH